MRSAPLRASSPFAATLNLTVPAPVAAAPAVTVIQETVAVAVHAQSLRVVTFVVRSPPADGTSIVAGKVANVQGAAACVTVTVCVAMVSAPTRAAPGLAAMLSCTDPAPVPAAPEPMVIQGTLEVAVHGQ